MIFVMEVKSKFFDTTALGRLRKDPPKTTRKGSILVLPGIRLMARSAVPELSASQPASTTESTRKRNNPKEPGGQLVRKYTCDHVGCCDLVRASIFAPNLFWIFSAQPRMSDCFQITHGRWELNLKRKLTRVTVFVLYSKLIQSSQMQNYDTDQKR